MCWCVYNWLNIIVIHMPSLKRPANLKWVFFVVKKKKTQNIFLNLTTLLSTFACMWLAMENLLLVGEELSSVLCG